MSSKLFRTRQGTILLGVAAAVLAAIALVVYLNQYRNSVKTNAAPVRVLVAKKLIPQDTGGAVIASTGLYAWHSYAKADVPTGAFVDTSELAGKVAVRQINPGDPLVASEFGSDVSVTQALSRTQRAVVIPLDSPGEVGGEIEPGNVVDVYALINVTAADGSTRPVVREILQNMYVLGTNANGNVTLRANPKQAGELIYASGNDKIWLTLRPPRGSMPKKATITSNTLLGG